jgi:hypothetical protein
LDKALRPLWEIPQKKYQGLFRLHEASQAVTAVYLHAKSENDGKKLEAASELAIATLRQISAIIGKIPEFQAQSPPAWAKLWACTLAVVNRGPPSLDDYSFCYGLLDIGSQLSRLISPPNDIPVELREQMAEVLKGSKVDQFRLKAVRIILQPHRSISTINRAFFSCPAKINS